MYQEGLSMTTQIENILEIAADALKQLGAREIYVFGSMFYRLKRIESGAR